MATIKPTAGSKLRNNSTGEEVTASGSATYNPDKWTVVYAAPASNEGNTNTGGTTNTGGGTTSGGTTPPPPNYEQELEDLLEKYDLSDDDKKAITAYYGALANNNEEEAQRLAANLELGATFADPIFKQKIAIVTDGLVRNFNSIGDNLIFQERQLSQRLQDLRADIEYAGANLTLDEQAELRALERSYSETLATTQDNLAASGFTTSSRRTTREGILADQRGDLVESTRRRFASQQKSLTDQLAREERDTQQEVERLRNLSQEQKVDLARKAEEILGSDRIDSSLAGTGVTKLGGLTGSAEIERRNDIAQFVF
jgi:hypothetical protein